MAFKISLQATLWHLVIIPEMIACRHPERIWSALSACWQSGHWRLVDILKRTACFWLEGCLWSSGKICASFGEEVWTFSKKRCSCLCGRVEADSGNTTSTLLLSWHDLVYGSSACGISVRLGRFRRYVNQGPCWGASMPDSCWLSFSAHQLVSKKGLPPGPTVRMVVSAGRLFPWQAWYFARASAHPFQASLAWDFTL